MAEFHCEILTPYRRFYSGKALSVLLVIHDGQIQILPGHESLVAPVRIGMITLGLEGGAKRAAVTEGFIRVVPGRVDIFVDAAEWPDEIDTERAERALGRAVKRMAAETHPWQIDASKRSAARAENRIAVAQAAAR